MRNPMPLHYIAADVEKQLCSAVQKLMQKARKELAILGYREDMDVDVWTYGGRLQTFGGRYMLTDVDFHYSFGSISISLRARKYLKGGTLGDHKHNLYFPEVRPLHGRPLSVKRTRK